MASTEQYQRHIRGIFHDLRRDDECLQQQLRRKSGLGALSIKYQQYTREAESLRALPHLNEFQKQRLAGLEKTIANLQGTLQKTR